ncbi:MAG TPA: VanW family protein [Anaerolineaceae bacterium]|nr:VanW family protein [Anaerolineaceae bacterium]
MKRRASTSSPSFFTQLGTALWLGLAIALVALLLINLTASAVFSSRVFPGVSMAGRSLSGLKLNQAASLITVTPGYPETGRITLTYADRTWVVTPTQLGVFTDPQATAQTAFKTGRSGSIDKVLLERLALLRGGIEIQPSFLYSENITVEYLKTIANEINQPLREASLEISGTTVIVNNGQPGRVLDIPATLALISAQLELMQDAVIPLVVFETQPQVLDVSAQGELAQAILSEPFKFVLPADLNAGAAEWVIEPAMLAKMLTFERVQNGDSTVLQLVANQPLVSAYLESLRGETDAAPENSRFIFNDETAQLELITPAVIGRSLNIPATIAGMNANLLEGKHRVKLAFDITEPAVTDTKTGAELGITELVYAYTSYFRGSSADRVQNIKTASATFHGLLIPPGGVLSMSDELGDISLDNGYAEALIILGDETIRGVGGGVCQVSTTLFRTAYFAGYPILERYAHAYRVGYYEQTASGHDANLAGLDATVFVPLVDFKFSNDTDYWLLMETYVNSNYSLTWKFYSTSDGRTVESHTTGPTNITDPPEPLYRENPKLDKGVVKQVDWAAEGANVVVRRTVTRNGAILYNDTFNTNYQPWRAIYEYGPGTENMPPEKTEGD